MAPNPKNRFERANFGTKFSKIMMNVNLTPLKFLGCHHLRKVRYQKLNRYLIKVIHKINFSNFVSDFKEK